MSKGRNQRKVTDYSGLSDTKHALTRADTYIGSTVRSVREVMVMNIDKMCLEKKTTTLPMGVERLLLEGLSNAGDNTDSSRRAGVDPGTIDIEANNKTISVKNGGLHIPVKKITLHDKNGNTSVTEYKEGDVNTEWLPVYVFGYFRTSNNYDEKIKRMGAGKNGFGAKLISIFSKRFQVVVEDPDSKLRLTAIWYDNMFVEDRSRKPTVEVVEDKGIKRGSVCVTWDLDFERFGMTEYSEEDLAIFARFAVDFSFTCKVRTSFNGTQFDYREISKYASLIWKEDQLKHHFIDYVWEDGANAKLVAAQQKTQERLIASAKKPEDIPEVEIMVIDSPDSAVCISYVNGLMTSDGGVHVDAAEEPVFKKIMEIMNRGLKRGRKNTITIKNLRPHMSFIVNARLCDPEYTSQSKTKLISPPVEVEYRGRNLRSLQDWSVIRRLYAEIEAMGSMKATKTDGIKRKHIDCQNGEDANFAGTKDSLKCTLMITEGLSASNYPQKRIVMLPGGKDIFGYLPMRGKILNITNAGIIQYSENTVISNIKKMLGLKEEVDYSIEANINTLRYGKILMCVDADDDGMHILAHVVNFFREKFPGILKRNMIGYLRTPVIKIFKKNKIQKRFFTVNDFDQWKEKTAMTGFTARYYKGLGTSNDQDIVDDMDTAPTVLCFYDANCDENMNLAFHQDFADERKKWIADWRDVAQTEDVTTMDVREFDALTRAQDISQFINRELVQYSVASLFRAIPSKYDMLKESQRKVLWSALEFFKYDPAKGKTVKTGRFANKAADFAHYHHGEKSLCDTTIKFAQNYIGSNNMEFLRPEGQFGTRADGGKNAADPRYSEIHLAWWIPHVYKREYIDLVERRLVDDEKAEPLWLPAVIPMGVVNGTNGIATGFSTSTASYNPLDVIRWIKDRCNGKRPKNITPWYNNFSGKIKIEVRNENKVVIEGDEQERLQGECIPKRSPDQEDADDAAFIQHAKNSKIRMKTYGTFEVTGFHKHGGPIVRVTEIPVRSWIHDYRKWLQGLVAMKGKKRPVFDFKDNSTTEKPNFLIHWNSDYCQPNHQNLHLVRSFGMSNITLIDHNGFPEKFTNINDVLETYFGTMLKHYGLVRDTRVANEKARLQDISYKIKFIGCVLSGEIVIMKTSEQSIRGKMEEHEIPYEYYEKSKSRDFSEESLKKNEELLEQCKAHLEHAENKVAKDIWLDDLNNLEKVIKKRMKNGMIV
jgi:DNA topoisomerase-2